MLSKPNNKFENDQEWVVAYYDLLGITKEMRRWDDAAGTIDKIQHLREHVVQMLLSMDRSLNKRGAEKPSLTKTLECEFEVFGFADTMVIASPLTNSFGIPQNMALSMLVRGATPLATLLLDLRILFTAGIDVGIARSIKRVRDHLGASPPPFEEVNNRITEGDIAGPAYVGAYKLASAQGLPPGLFLSDAAVALLHEAANCQGRFRGAWRASAKHTLKMLMRLNSKDQYTRVGRDAGDTWAVDWAAGATPPGCDLQHREVQHAHAILTAGYRWACDEVKAEHPPAVKYKFEWLKTYLKPHAAGKYRILRG